MSGTILEEYGITRKLLCYTASHIYERRRVIVYGIEHRDCVICGNHQSRELNALPVTESQSGYWSEWLDK